MSAENKRLYDILVIMTPSALLTRPSSSCAVSCQASTPPTRAPSERAGRQDLQQSDVWVQPEWGKALTYIKAQVGEHFYWNLQVIITFLGVDGHRLALYEAVGGGGGHLLQAAERGGPLLDNLDTYSNQPSQGAAFLNWCTWLTWPTWSKSRGWRLAALSATTTASGITRAFCPSTGE